MIYNNTMYQIDITGPIGVGKSTIIESIKSHFENVVHIPEYINGDKNGIVMLNRFINKEITIFEFQKYILDYYKEYKINLNKDSICVYERVPDDSIFVFSNYQYHNGSIDELKMYDLYAYAQYINYTKRIINYRTNKINCSIVKNDNYDECIKEIINIINDDIKNNIGSRIIILDIDFNTTLNRINKRSREGENNYDIKYLKDIYTIYKNLINLKSKGKIISFDNMNLLTN